MLCFHLLLILLLLNLLFIENHLLNKRIIEDNLVWRRVDLLHINWSQLIQSKWVHIWIRNTFTNSRLLVVDKFNIVHNWSHFFMPMFFACLLFKFNIILFIDFLFIIMPKFIYIFDISSKLTHVFVQGCLILLNFRLFGTLFLFMKIINIIALTILFWIRFFRLLFLIFLYFWFYMTLLFVRQTTFILFFAQEISIWFFVITLVFDLWFQLLMSSWWLSFFYSFRALLLSFTLFSLNCRIDLAWLFFYFR